jgi:sugar lactone lactonase YvrE
VPEQATDVAPGGPNRDVLYVTASTSVYRVQTRVTGLGSRVR